MESANGWNLSSDLDQLDVMAWDDDDPPGLEDQNHNPLSSELWEAMNSGMDSDELEPHADADADFYGFDNEDLSSLQGMLYTKNNANSIRLSGGPFNSLTLWSVTMEVSPQYLQ